MLPCKTIGKILIALELDENNKVAYGISSSLDLQSIKVALKRSLQLLEEQEEATDKESTNTSN